MASYFKEERQRGAVQELSREGQPSLKMDGKHCVTSTDLPKSSFFT